MTRARTDSISVLLPLLVTATACSAPASADDAQPPAQTAQAPPAVAARPTCSDAEGRYKVIDEFVVDHANGARVWQRFVPEPLFTRDEAAAYCARVTLGRHTVWRLPTAQELMSIELHPAGLIGGPSTCVPAIDQTAFPDTPAADFWTSTVRAAGDAMFVGFDDGRDHFSTLETELNVRCVTDPS